ncbi:putative DNA-binding transcriptional regulator AlpA [Bradyrhizobium diazoefficiens]
MHSSSPTTSPYRDTQGASAHSGLSVSFLEKLRVVGGGPPFIKVGKAVRYKLSDVDTWLAARTCNSTSEYAA